MLCVWRRKQRSSPRLRQPFRYSLPRLIRRCRAATTHRTVQKRNNGRRLHVLSDSRPQLIRAFLHFHFKKLKTVQFGRSREFSPAEHRPKGPEINSGGKNADFYSQKHPSVTIGP